MTVLVSRLPAGWTIQPLKDTALSDHGVDASVTVMAPDGASAILVLEAKRVVEGRDVVAVRDRLARFTRRAPGSRGVVIAGYLSPPVRKRLSDAGLSYIDATGNVLLDVSRPGLYIATQGADRDPWRGPGRPPGTLKGAPAAKIVRALLDYDRAWRIRELVDAARVSTGSTYRVIEFLKSEGLAVRGESGMVTVPDWVALLRRWSGDYGFVRNSRVTRWIAPRGLPDIVKRAAGSPVRYAVTGTLAAAEWAAYAPARSAMIYTADAGRTAQLWGLRAAEAGANVMLAEPGIDVVFTRTVVTASDLTIAAPAQVAVDLMTGPGRSPSEAEELIEWMIRNESSWRR
ncbi:hypothetical protein FHS43_001043 [Streptosporangium becharense]|uniref:HTH iclR-type domain-containing protein n=1 Tax=Streptosporangium becharense TaxID=1816182 RepID=A0A7W9IEK3_9ACTN|nr:hypothetical protein [Streptosporangium becharense]MBB2909797.1 hypothetical protein [Streptosporangium becharense]MBB5819247.1 hypothetical protein [Streptosporangium becharense]